MIWRSHGKGYTTCAVKECKPDLPAWRVSVYKEGDDELAPPIRQFWGTKSGALKKAVRYIKKTTGCS